MKSRGSKKITRGNYSRKIESRLGRRDPKRCISKFLNEAAIFSDWPFFGRFGKPLKKEVKIARRKEKLEALRIEKLNESFESSSSD
jgi:hypothetical protein